MSERFRKGIVFGALFLAIIWGIYNFLPKSAPIPEVQRVVVSPPAKLAVPRLASIEKTINVAEIKSKSWGDDPFRAIDNNSGYR